MAKSSLSMQCYALLKRNFLLKSRNKKHTLQEILYPVYFVLILAITRFSVRPQERPAVEAFPENDIDTEKFMSFKTLYVSPDTTEIRNFMTDALRVFGNISSDVPYAPDVRYFSSKNEAEDKYREESGDVGLGIHFHEDDLMKYTLRASLKQVPSTKDKYTTPGECRDKSGEAYCNGNKYLYSGFVNLQRAIETSLITNSSGFHTPMPELKVQLYPKEAWTPVSTYLQTLSSVYLVLAYSPFVNFLTVCLVSEKEKKIRDAMKMMGMRDSAWWFSWGAVYTVIILIINLLCLLLIWAMKFLGNSDVFIFFIHLTLYGLSIITFAFMLTPFFSKADKAGGLASLSSMLFTLLYLGVALTRSDGENGRESSIPFAAQVLFSLLSPVAFALGIDQAVYLDLQEGGLSWDNINEGEYPFSLALIMLCVDCVLYGLLAVYFDNVIPNEFGQRQRWYFFVQPSFWCPRTRKHDEVVQRQYSTHAEVPADYIETIPAQLYDKDVISIMDVKKQFPSKEKSKLVKAVDGLSLDLYEGQITCLLGHNGAGKTTLMNILTGLTPATSGTATIYGYDVSDNGDMNEIRAMTGVCPQHNILFEDLTCAEHLQFYGLLKGVTSAELTEEVTKALADVDLKDQTETRSGKLSGGQKRKLSVAIALIGDPKVILLDEPTAGMDPYSRRHLWSVLKARRPNRVILLTTHFMDEADILADRKAFMSKGALQCVGSSLFLKNRFGVGYHLGLVVESINDVIIGRVTSLIQRHVPEAELLRHHGMELNYTLPLATVSLFATLFDELEKHVKSRTPQNGVLIRSYGVSMTTLEEVFLKLGVAEECDDADDDVIDHVTEPLLSQHHRSRVSPEPPASTIHSTDRESSHVHINTKLNSAVYNTNGNSKLSERAYDVEPAMPTVNVCSNENDDLFTRRFKALVRVRALLVWRNKGIVVFRCVIPLILIIAGSCVQKFVQPVTTSDALEPLELEPELYTRVFDESRGKPNVTYELESNSPEAMDFVNKMRDQGLYLTQTDSNTDYLDIAPHHLGLALYDVTNATGALFTNLTTLYNDTAVHSLPVIINLVSNTILGLVNTNNNNNADRSIRLITEPWPSTQSELGGFNGNVFGSVMLLGMALVLLPPSFGVSVVKDKEKHCRSQLRISGASMKLYWSSTMLVDGAQFILTCLAALIILLAFQTEALMYAGAVIALLLLYACYIPVTMLVAYCLSYAFDKMETAQTTIINLFSFLSILPYIAVAMCDAWAPEAATYLHIVFVCIDPPYAVYGGFYYLSRIYLIEVVTQGTSDPEIPVSEYFKWDNMILICIIVPFFQAVGFFFLMRYLEIRTTGGDTTETCCCKRGDDSATSVPTDNDDVPIAEDDDVSAERSRVQDMSADQREESVTIVENLRKEFQSSTGCCGKKKSTKVAVRNNTFAVSRGEVLGLLGPNGAGKTTTLNMIIAETGPTRGRVCVCGQDIRSSLSDAFQAMGYCAQHDALWDQITLREHIEIYAQLRGIALEYIPTVVDFFLDSLQIQEHADKAAKKLSGGTKRKLSYALSMLGDPQIVLMDEPSTGMDPKSKRFLWNTISGAFEGSDRGAILTTHYMEEADALCSRVAIMINGTMQCIGSTQHLKNKFGSGYLLEIKHKTMHDTNAAENNKAAIEAFVHRLFTNAELSETFGDRLMYAVPQADVVSLADIFAALEKGKEDYDIEEYSFSQSTLEQVFLEFAKLQHEEEAPGTKTKYQPSEEGEIEVKLQQRRSTMRDHSHAAVNQTLATPTAVNQAQATPSHVQAASNGLYRHDGNSTNGSANITYL